MWESWWEREWVAVVWLSLSGYEKRDSVNLSTTCQPKRTQLPVMARRAREPGERGRLTAARDVARGQMGDIAAAQQDTSGLMKSKSVKQHRIRYLIFQGLHLQT